MAPLQSAPFPTSSQMADFFSIPLPPSVPGTPVPASTPRPHSLGPHTVSGGGDGNPTRFEQALRERFHPSAASSVHPLHFPGMPAPRPSLSFLPPSPTTPPPAPSLASLSLRSPPPGPSLPTPAPQLFPPSILLPHLTSPTSQPTLLILDLRPPSHYTTSHLPPSISLSLPIPSTLLRRPAFPLSSISSMLPPSSQPTFTSWPTCSLVLILEKDPSGLSEGGKGLVSKLLKARPADSSVQIGGIKGGWDALARAYPQYCTSSSELPINPSSTTTTTANGGLRNLPTAAFQQISTTSAASRPIIKSPPSSSLTSHAHGQLPAPGPSSSTLLFTNPFYDNIRQHLELAQGPTASSFVPLLLPASTPLHPHFSLLPKWLRDIVARAELFSPSNSTTSSIAAPTELECLDPNAPKRGDAGESLAMQFYRIEHAEQRRLQGVMDHHSQASHVVGVETPGEVPVGARGDGEDDERGARGQGGKVEFPFSITAGIEKGALNRYRNIWPFAHTRVRLPKGSASDGSDYVNASFVRPRGTRRRYVCAQGPLEGTRGDFWNLVWDQDIRIIIMLTKQTEAGLTKCCSYWSTEDQGAFTLRPIEASGGEDEPDAPGGFFDMASVNKKGEGEGERRAIRRVFGLGRKDGGRREERKVTQLQMVSWPDWEVPRTPEALLDLIKQVDALLKTQEGDGPVLVHCSAGVGRTGSFVLIDAVLDGLRQELEERRERMARGEVDSEVEVEGSPEGEGSPRDEDVEMDGEVEVGERDEVVDMDPHYPAPSFASLPSSLPEPSLSSSMSVTSFATPSLATTRTSHIPAPSSSLARKPSPTHAHSQAQNSHDHERPTSFDYILPRSYQAPPRTSLTRTKMPSPEHDRPPTPLSAMTPEPVRAILEDMREQRMSLCQSLRQYVFVHRAIVAGALQLLDEIFPPSPAPTTLPNTFPAQLHLQTPTQTHPPSAFPLSNPPPMKRHASASPTEVLPATHRLIKRPSVKRKMSERGRTREQGAEHGFFQQGV